jgi:hypothetical protein
MRRIRVVNLATRRNTGSLHNLFIGDALSMPVHWFYRTLGIIASFIPAGLARWRRLFMCIVVPS